MSEEKESILDLPKNLGSAVKPITEMTQHDRDEFRKFVVARCSWEQLHNAYRESWDSFSFGKGDSIDEALSTCYEEEIKEREQKPWRKDGTSGSTMDSDELKRFSLFIKRHSQYLFSSTSDGSENKRFS